MEVTGDSWRDIVGTEVDLGSRWLLTTVILIGFLVNHKIIETPTLVFFVSVAAKGLKAIGCTWPSSSWHNSTEWKSQFSFLRFVEFPAQEARADEVQLRLRHRALESQQ